MTVAPVSALTAAIGTAAQTAWLSLLSTSQGTDFHGQPTTVFEFAAPSADRNLRLELSAEFDFHKPDLLPAMTTHLAEEARRLRNPRPDCYVTIEGLPLSLRNFRWPFHRSTSGADTFIVHGEAHLEDGTGSPLHALISAAMTVTFAEIVPAPEQPYAETFLYNAVRKTFDNGQLELVKSGNRQPVFVTTRYYSRWQKKFFFNDTDDATRLEYILLKTYWLSGVLGQSRPVWIADPRDAQYLNTTEADLLRMAADEAGQGLLTLSGEYAAPTQALMDRAQDFAARMNKALDITKPKFNEAMRSGQANM
jgi:hypothetical protein